MGFGYDANLCYNLIVVQLSPTAEPKDYIYSVARGSSIMSFEYDVRPSVGLVILFPVESAMPWVYCYLPMMLNSYNRFAAFLALKGQCIGIVYPREAI